MTSSTIDGTSGSPTIFEAGKTGLAETLTMELQSVDKLKAGAVHLRYRVSAR